LGEAGKRDGHTGDCGTPRSVLPRDARALGDYIAGLRALMEGGVDAAAIAAFTAAFLRQRGVPDAAEYECWLYMHVALCWHRGVDPGTLEGSAPALEPES
jgi:hypothetical protein